MRQLTALLLALATCLAVATSADARRKATAKEKRQIAQIFNAPPKCSKVYISTVNERWGSYQFDHRKIDVEPCDQVAADGIAIVRKRNGRWRFVTAGSSFECPVPDVPRRVAKDLRIPCE